MNKLPEHLFVSDCDGSLYDTRKPYWSANPVRAIYSRTFREINNTQQLRATIRAGGYAWPGGYPLFLITADGEYVSFKAATKEYKMLSNDFHHFPRQRVIGCEIYYEGPPVGCALSGEMIESAYGDPDVKESAE